MATQNNTSSTSNTISDEKLAAAMEKLSCKVELPKSPGSCSSSGDETPGVTDGAKAAPVRLTEMTSAGG